MEKCVKCCSEEIDIEIKNFEDFHKVAKVSCCKKCNNLEITEINLQDGSVNCE
jgi:hypothetical protein